jgi:hypothetical protein|tara:strand:+ start:76 stop:243 length:168 start_codon:yes stop_codon:yes gene_type:complete
MTTRIDTNETFDANGNLIFSEQVEVVIADNAMTEVVAGLSAEQREALLLALQTVA